MFLGIAIFSRLFIQWVLYRVFTPGVESLVDKYCEKHHFSPTNQRGRFCAGRILVQNWMQRVFSFCLAAGDWANLSRNQDLVILCQNKNLVVHPHFYEEQEIHPVPWQLIRKTVENPILTEPETRQWRAYKIYHQVFPSANKPNGRYLVRVIINEEEGFLISAIPYTRPNQIKRILHENNNNNECLPKSEPVWQ